MNIEYWIKVDQDWIQVDCQAYFSYVGEKEIRPSTWRLMLMQSLLEKYRYM